MLQKGNYLISAERKTFIAVTEGTSYYCQMKGITLSKQSGILKTTAVEV